MVISSTQPRQGLARSRSGRLSPVDVNVVVDHLVGAPYESLRAGAVGSTLGPLVKLENKKAAPESEMNLTSQTKTQAPANTGEIWLLWMIGEGEREEEGRDTQRDDKPTTI